MSVDKFKQIHFLLKNEQADEAKQAFDLISPESSTDYLLLKGKLEQKFQNWSKAMNAYSKVIEIEPDNKEANNNLHFIKNILNFWSPEMFNP